MDPGLSGYWQSSVVRSHPIQGRKAIPSTGYLLASGCLEFMPNEVTTYDPECISFLAHRVVVKAVGSSDLVQSKGQKHEEPCTREREGEW